MRQIGQASILAFLIVCLAACATSGARQTPYGKETQPSSMEEVKLLGLNFPSTLGGLQRTKVIEYSDQRLGYGVTYYGSNAYASIYVFDAGIKDIPDDLDSPALTKVFQQNVQGLLALPQAGIRTKEIAPLGESYVLKEEGQPGFKAMEFAAKSARGSENTNFLLTAWKGRFVSIMITGFDAMTIGPLTKEIARDLGRILWPGAMS